jgi:dienelactone hydrolase
MKNNRREFLKVTGITGIALAGAGIISACSSAGEKNETKVAATNNPEDAGKSIIGLYGPWAASMRSKELPELSFRRDEFTNVNTWSKTARERLIERLASPALGKSPKVTVHKKYSYDGLDIEELSWELPYGRPTEAILLKPTNAKGPLPGILAFHDHGLDKFNGKVKLVQTSDQRNPMIEAHQKEYYSGRAWANEIARRGYVVLVSDAFTFASRRVKLEDVPVHMRDGLDFENPEKIENITAYNKWAAQHEHVMAKSLFSAGTTWPGVFLAEDRVALDVLCNRQEIDANRIGCAGLSGGGVRTLYISAVDPRIKCSVPVGFMTTSQDMITNQSFTHTWMAFTPGLAKEMDFAEVIGVRAPLPTLVLNNTEDPLFTLSEMKEADKILRAVYSKAGADERYKCSFHPGVHKFDKAMQEEAFDWFDRWLKA